MENQATTKHHATADLYRSLSVKDALWSKKTKLEWSIRGYRCSHFFHCTVNDRAKAHSLDTILFYGKKFLIQGKLLNILKNFTGLYI